jgi:hypothetical protein
MWTMMDGRRAPDNLRLSLRWIAGESKKRSPNKALQQNRDDVLRC